ncbi:hypothetical protein ACQP2E_20870 [Actinoplanes sp. CA-015351]|uniref:WD40 repeat domain-containing protein n=1 Tax=Actinoplanes sp. CA-015351 TaxID=3239897 RepID=UPI003D98E200
MTSPAAWAEAMGSTVGRTMRSACPYRGLDFHVRGMAASGSLVEPVTTVHGGARYAAAADEVHRRGAGPVWSTRLATDGPILDLDVSADGEFVAVTAGEPSAGIHVLRADDGEVHWVLSGHRACAFDPRRPGHLAVTGPEGLTVVDVREQDVLVRRPERDELGRPAWAPAGTHLAAGTRNRILIWSVATWARDVVVEAPGPHGMYGRIAWSPDGTRLAAAPGRPRHGPVHVWDTRSWRVVRLLGETSGPQQAPALCWSPDGTALCFVAAPDSIEVWDVAGDVLLAVLRPVPGDHDRHSPLWAVRWNEPGSIEVGTYVSGTVECAFSPPPPGAAAPEVPLPHDCRPAEVASLGAVVASSGAEVPLRLLADLLVATGTSGPLLATAVAHSAAMARLRALDWPARARYGIVLLIAKHIRGQARFRAPKDVPRHRLEADLQRVLTAYHCPAEPVDVREEIVAMAVDQVAGRFLGLLTILGPRAIAADPLLPVRLLGLPSLPELPPVARELIDQQPIGGDLRHQGSGTGGGYTGLSRRGSLARLLPRELAITQPSLEARFANHDLLFRTAEGADPRLSGTVVVVLDDTPPAFGRVGVTLRSVAHLVGAAQVRSRRRVAVISLGDPADVRWITAPAELVLLWDHWRATPARPRDAARALTAVRRDADDGRSGPARAILLTQPYQSFPEVPGLRRVDVIRPGGASAQRSPHRFELVTDPEAGQMRRLLVELIR